MIFSDKIINTKISYNNETKYKLKWIINDRDINNDHDNDYDNRKGFNKQLQQKNTRLIFENVTKKSRFKNPARRINTFPFLLQSLYTIIISIIWNLFC